MAVPDYQSVMLPLLQLADERKAEVSADDAVEALATRLGLTDDDLKEMLPSGVQRTFVNRVGWAATYMKKAGLLEPTRRGYYRITPISLRKIQKRSTSNCSNSIPSSLSSRNSKEREKANTSKDALDIETATPSEALENAYENLRNELVDELLSKLKKSSPSFFERIVVDLLVKMGYGGSRADAGKAIGKSGDGGIDGIIKKTSSDWMLSTFRRNDGTTLPSEVLTLCSSLEHYRHRSNQRHLYHDFQIHRRCS